MIFGSDSRSHRARAVILLLTSVGCVRLDNAPPAKEAVEAALGTECLPAAISGERVNTPGVVTTGDLLGFEIRSAYLGTNPFELQGGTGLKRLTDSLMRNDADTRGSSVWPIDVQLAVHKGATTPVDTIGFRCYALQDRFGELRVIEHQPERIGSWATQLFSRVSGLFK